MKRKRKTQYPQWPHPAGDYGDIQPVYEPPIRRVIKRALLCVALFVFLLIIVTGFGLALQEIASNPFHLFFDAIRGLARGLR